MCWAAKTGEEKTFLLSDVATVENTTSLMSISRMEQRRYLNVTATIAEGENVTWSPATRSRLCER